MGEDSEEWLLSEPRPYKNIVRTGYIQQKKLENYIHKVIYVCIRCVISRFMLTKITVIITTFAVVT